ncbi:hypothetical protein B0H14DRAFT_2601544 [Mycena olivaceomarginata]|nr:hypothetical protein B0H14DRAFT_2601544 [Mycena olivaceomarginata]
MTLPQPSGIIEYLISTSATDDPPSSVASTGPASVTYPSPTSVTSPSPSSVAPQAPPRSLTPVTPPLPLLAPPRSPSPVHAPTAPPAKVKGKKRNAATAALDSVEAAADDTVGRGPFIKLGRSLGFPFLGTCLVPLPSLQTLYEITPFSWLSVLGNVFGSVAK